MSLWKKKKERKNETMNEVSKMNFVVDSLNVLERWLENKWIQIIIIGLLTWVTVHIIGKLISHFFKKTNS